MRGSPAHLGGLSALLGLLSVLSISVFGFYLLPLVFPSCALGFVGAWEVGKHRKAGSLALLVGGLLPLTPYLLLANGPDFHPTLFGFVLFLWWSPLLILAGILGFLNLPNKPLSQEDDEEWPGEEDYMRSAN